MPKRKIIIIFVHRYPNQSLSKQFPMKKLLISFSLAAISSMAAGAGELVPVFQESFSRCKSETIQGGYFSEDYYFTAADHGDSDGWTTQHAYVAERAVKFNAKTKPSGYAITPAMKFSTATARTVVVRFRAQKWAHKDDLVDVYVQVEGDAASAQHVDADVSTNVSDRDEAPFELTFTDVPDGSKFRFYAVKKAGAVTDRWFLSDVTVLEEQDAPAGAHIYTSAGYQRFADIMVGHDSEVRSIAVNAVGLTDDITIEQPEASAFRVEKKDWDARRGGTLELRFYPQQSGVADETLTLRSGTASRSFILCGHSKVYAPVADEATNVSETSFTANWHDVAGLDPVVLRVYTKDQAPLVASDLMFTKYIEGKSNNRALEIFNGTGHDVSLKGYRLAMESNGAGGLTYGEYAFADDAVIKAGGTFTVCNSNYNALRDIADVTIGFNNGGYANITTFTGDDAIALFAPDGHVVDLLGYESIDTNDRVDRNWGQDKTFYRKSSSYEPSDKFRIEEWDQHPMDYCEGYGTHVMDAYGPVKRDIKVLELPRGTTSADLSDIPAGTPCYYTVQGISGDVKTPVSVEIAVGNAPAGIDGVEADDADAPAEYYNMQGMRIDRPAAGVCIVRRGAKVAKVFVR